MAEGVEVDAGVDPVDEDPDEDVDELDEESGEDEGGELVSLFELEELEASPPDVLCEPAPLSCFPSAEEPGFERFGSFNLFE